MIKKKQVRDIDGKYLPVKLTDKQKAFADDRLENPKTSRTESAMKTYNTLDKKTGAVIASRNMSNVNILVYMNKHQEKAQENIIDLADNAKNESVKLKANVDILDRVHGRSVARTVKVTGTIESLIDDDDTVDDTVIDV